MSKNELDARPGCAADALNLPPLPEPEPVLVFREREREREAPLIRAREVALPLREQSKDALGHG